MGLLIFITTIIIMKCIWLLLSPGEHLPCRQHLFIALVSHTIFGRCAWLKDTK